MGRYYWIILFFYEKIMNKEELKLLCEWIKNQDNRATQYPIYQVLTSKLQLGNPDDSDSYEVRCDDEWIVWNVWEIDWIDYLWAEYVKEYLVEELKLFYEFQEDENIKDILIENEIDIEDYLEDMNDTLFKQYVKPVCIPYRDNFFLTESYAEKFLRDNVHNMEDPIIYVVSAYRNEQIKLIVHHLFEESWVELPSFWR